MLDAALDANMMKARWLELYLRKSSSHFLLPFN